MWGENKPLTSDPDKFRSHWMSKMSPPDIRAPGPDPSEWDADLPDQLVKPGDVWSVVLEKGAPADAPMIWQKTEEGLGDEIDLDDVSYSIVGDFNSWTAQMMEDGDAPGSRNIIVEVPDSGELRFRFVQTVDEDMVLAPAQDHCTKKAAQIVGPAPDLTNSWIAKGPAGSSLQISLFTSHGRRGVSWK